MGKMPIGPTARMAVLQRTGQGWIRTSEGVKPADLQSAPFGHSGTYPFASVDIGSRQMRRKCALLRVACMVRFAVQPGNTLLINTGLQAGADAALSRRQPFSTAFMGRPE